MGKKLNALLGRNFKSSKFKATVNLAVSRLAVLKNQRRARCSIARSDVAQLLNLGHHERALLRVEQVIKEQNMVDVYLMIEGYCHLLIERVNLVENKNVCPEELKEAISSLLYSAARCGEFPELQELRAIFTSRFGREFAARAIELHNNCGVNPKIIQKLSTRMPSLENRLKVLKEIASENSIVLQIEESFSGVAELEELKGDHQKQMQPKPESDANHGDTKQGDNKLTVLLEDFESVEDFSDQIKAKNKYRDVADAAQAAFESAAYAAAAARVAVELSRSEPHDPGYKTSPRSGGQRKVGHGENYDLGSEKIHPIQDLHSVSSSSEVHVGSDLKEFKQRKNGTEVNRPLSVSSSSDLDDMLKGNNTLLPSSSDTAESRTKPLGSEIVFDESDDDIEDEPHEIPWSRNKIKKEDLHPEEYSTKLKASFALGSRIQGSEHSDGLKRPMSTRTWRRNGH